MKVQITISRIDNGHEPWSFEESRYPDISIAREQWQMSLNKFNELAQHTGQVGLQVKAEIVPLPEEQHATPLPREAQRLALSELAAKKK